MPWVVAALMAAGIAFYEWVQVWFDVDHVVIGATGIYCVETKTHSKPPKIAANVRYDGQNITVDGYTPDRDPVVQARAQARWLRELLEKSTGKSFKVQPVVLFPGWFIETTVQWPEVWVQNEKSFSATVTKQKRIVDAADVHLVAYHLTRHVIGRS